MISLILRPFSEFIQQPLVLVGLILITVGIAVFCSARNITRTIRKTKDVKPNDKAFVISFSIGLVVFLAGILCIVLGMYFGMN